LSVDFESLSDVLKHPVRRKIILALSERGNLPYVDLMNFVGVSSTGKFNYHLKILGDLIEKDQIGRYVLTEKAEGCPSSSKVSKEEASTNNFVYGGRCGDRFCRRSPDGG